MFHLTFDGIRLSVEDDVCRAEGPPGAIIVDSSGPQVPELREELLDVGVGDAKVQVRHHQLGGASGGEHARTGEGTSHSGTTASETV